MHESFLRCIVYIRSLSNYALEEVLHLTQGQGQGQGVAVAQPSSFSTSSLRFIIKDILQSTVDMDRVCAIYSHCCEQVQQAGSTSISTSVDSAADRVLGIQSELIENISIIIYHTVYIALNNLSLGSSSAGGGNSRSAAVSGQANSLFLKNWYHKSLRECIGRTHALIANTTGPRGHSIDYMPYLVMRNIVDVFTQSYPDDPSMHFDAAADAGSSSTNTNTNRREL